MSIDVAPEVTATELDEMLAVESAEPTVADLEAQYVAREAELIAEFEAWKKNAVTVAKKRRRTDGWCSTFLTAMADAGMRVEREVFGTVHFAMDFNAGEGKDLHEVDAALRDFMESLELVTPNLPEGIEITKPLSFSQLETHSE